ncbi:MAG: AsmA family protein [Candidatus Acidiferrales bacterium]
MKRWVKVLLAVGGVVVLVAVAIPLFVNANTFRPVIQKQLSATLGREVQFGELRLSVFSGSLIARDLSVADDPAFSTVPFLTAKELRIGVSLRPLIFAHQVNLRSFRIESPQINVIRAANGTWNCSSIGHGAANGASAGAAGATLGTPRVGSPRLPDFSIGLIVIEDGRVVIGSQPTRDQPSVYENVNLTAHDFSFASRFPFELDADLPAGGTISVTGHLGPINRDDAATSPAEAQISVKGLDPVAAGFLDADAGVSLLADLDAHVSFDGQTLTSSGTARIENLKLRKGATAAPKALDLSYSVAHRLKENAGQINDATVQIGGAAIHVNGSYQPVTPDVRDPMLSLKLSGQSLPIDELQSLMTAAAVRLPNGSVLKGGTVSMNLSITGLTKALVITGPIALDNVRLVGFDIGSKIHGIAALSGVKTGDATDFQKLRVNVRITNAGVVANGIDAVIPAMGELTGSGTVSPSNQLDFNLIVKVASANGVGKIGVGLLTALHGSGGSGKGSGVPMRVTGTPEEPYITADVGGIVTKRAKSIASIFGKKN